MGQQGLHQSAMVLQWMEKWLLQEQQAPSALEVTLALEVTSARLVGFCTGGAPGHSGVVGATLPGEDMSFLMGSALGCCL